MKFARQIDVHKPILNLF